MKIGIISNVDRVGKTYFGIALSHVYARSQKSKVAYFTTSALTHVIEPIMQTQDKDESATAGVFKAMLETGTIRGDELFNYAVRSPRDEVYFFDLFNRRSNQTQNLDFLLRTINLIKANMIIVEICGDPASDVNTKLLEDCNVILNLFTADNSSIKAIREFDKSISEEIRYKTRYICSMYDPRILSEKKVSALLGKGRNDIHQFSYNPGIAKLFLNGDYCEFADKTVYGTSEEFVSTRGEFLTILQMLYDEPGRKRIKELKDWSESK